MVGGTLALIVLYVWTAAVIYGVVSDYTVLANSARPLATAAEAVLGDTAIAVGGLLAAASSVHAVMAAGIKMPYSWSWDEVFPARFSAVNDRFGTPHWSLLTLYVVASALTFWSAGLDQAIAVSTFSYLIAYFAVSLTAGYVYLRRPDVTRRAAFDPGALVLLPIAVAALGSFALLTRAYRGSLAVYVPWLVVGLAVFSAYWHLGRRRGTDVEAILGTLPGVPTAEYDPDLDGVAPPGDARSDADRRDID